MNTAAPAKKPRREIAPDVTFGKAYDAKLVKRLAVYVKPYQGLFVLALLSYPATSALHLLQPYLVKVAIDRHLVPKDLSGFGWVLVGLVGVIVLELLARFAQTMLTQILGQRVTRDLRVELFRRLQAADLSYIEKNPVGRLMTRVTNDVESLSEAFSSGAVSLVGDLVTLFGIVVMMLALDWRLTLYAFLVLPFLLAMTLLMRKYVRETFRQVRLELSRMNGFLNEAISGMSLIQAFRQEAGMRQEFDEVNVRYRDANFGSIRYDAITYAVVEGMGTAAVAVLLLLGLGLFEAGAVQLGTFVAFIDYLRRFFAPITELSTKYTVLQSAMASAERCVDLLDQHPTVLEPTHPVHPGPLKDAIRFESVGFAYGPGAPPVLRSLNLTLKKGERVAVVGPTGAGKSTLVKLLCRFYDPTSGRLTLDGVDFRELPLADLRRRMAVVLQDSYLFSGTIEDNVALGAHADDKQRLLAAAERTHALEVIRRQGKGWETVVGERGANLSAGERQLIAFARALAVDPEFLLLDEATSSIDPETEALLQKGLDALLEGRTALIIAHRLSTIRKVDRIVVVAGGEIVEEGTHEALLAKGGLYRKLYELQFEKEAA